MSSHSLILTDSVCPLDVEDWVFAWSLTWYRCTASSKDSVFYVLMTAQIWSKSSCAEISGQAASKDSVLYVLTTAHVCQLDSDRLWLSSRHNRSSLCLKLDLRFVCSFILTDLGCRDIEDWAFAWSLISFCAQLDPQGLRLSSRCRRLSLYLKLDLKSVRSLILTDLGRPWDIED